MEEILKLVLSNPTAATGVIKKYVDIYKPHIYELLKEIVEIMKDYSNNTEYHAIVAKSKKNRYDAYVNVGFTEDQALALMINDNIQLMERVKKSVSSSQKNSAK